MTERGERPAASLDEVVADLLEPRREVKGYRFLRLDSPPGDPVAILENEFSVDGRPVYLNLDSLKERRENLRRRGEWCSATELAIAEIGRAKRLAAAVLDEGTPDAR